MCRLHEVQAGVGLVRVVTHAGAARLRRRVASAVSEHQGGSRLGTHREVCPFSRSQDSAFMGVHVGHLHETRWGPPWVSHQAACCTSGPQAGAAPSLCSTSSFPSQVGAGQPGEEGGSELLDTPAPSSWVPHNILPWAVNVAVAMATLGIPSILLLFPKELMQ